MTVREILDRVMFQTNNDVEDVEEYLPYLITYVNEGYDILTEAFTGEHLADELFLTEEHEDDVPALPLWSHPAIADYATWLVYRNSNPAKQQRGMAFLQAFQQVRGRLEAASFKGGRFYNVD